MTKAKQEKRIVVPLGYEVESIGIGAMRWPGGEHQLADHETHPIEGPGGDWNVLMGHPGFEYRRTICECGYMVTEGRPIDGEPEKEPDLLVQPPVAAEPEAVADAEEAAPAPAEG